MNKINWEGVIALLLALAYGLIIGCWCRDTHFSKVDLYVEAAELAPEAETDATEQCVVCFEQEKDYEDYLACVEKKREKERKATEKEQRKAECETLRIQDNEELYKLLDDLDDTDKLQKIRTDKKFQKETYAKLQAALKDLEDHGQKISFVVLDLNYGIGFAKNPKEMIYSASAIKGPYVCSAVSQNPEKADGYKWAIEPTIKVSSNSDYESVHMAFGFDLINNWCEETHIETLNQVEYYSDVTAVDMGKLWIKSWEYLDRDDDRTKWLKGLFVHTLNSVMSDGLADEDTTVYSKAGWIADGYYGNVQNDAGVVVQKGKDPYLMVILSSAYAQNDKLEHVAALLDEIMTDLRKL